MSRESDIIGGLKIGDEKAYSYIFKRYYNPLCKYMSTRIEGDDNTIKDLTVEARDLTNEIFVSIWEARENFESIAKLEAYMFVVASNKCKRWFDLERQKNVFLDGLYYVSKKEQLPEDKPVNPEELIAKINKHLHKLPDRCRRVFTLFYFKGYSLKKIAEILNVEVGTVQKHKAVALDKLRDILNPQEANCSF